MDESYKLKNLLFIFFFFFCFCFFFFQNIYGLFYFFFFSSRRRHTRWPRDWSSDVALPISLIKLASSEARNSTSSAHSMGVPWRCSGIAARAAWAKASPPLWKKPVSAICPGWIELTRTFHGENCNTAVLVSPRNPHF